MTARKGYTLIEIGMVVVVVAIVMIVCMPDTDEKAREEAKLASWQFESDVAYARNLSLADPTDPIKVKVDVNANKYWLAKSSNPNVPIKHPQTGKDFEVKFGSNTGAKYRYASLTAIDFGGSTELTFDAMGNTNLPQPALLQLSAGGVQYEVQIAPAAAKTNVLQGYTKTIQSGGTVVAEPSNGEPGKDPFETTPIVVN